MAVAGVVAAVADDAVVGRGQIRPGLELELVLRRQSVAKLPQRSLTLHAPTRAMVADVAAVAVGGAVAAVRVVQRQRSNNKASSR